MIALRRWAFGRKGSREAIVSALSAFLMRGLGFREAGESTRMPARQER